MINISILAKKIDGLIEGDSNLTVRGIGDLRSSPSDFISFLSDQRYYKYFKESLSNVIIVNKKFSNPRLEKTLIRVDNPVFAYIKILEHFSSSKQNKTGIHDTAIISKNVQIDSFTSILNDTYIGYNVKIGLLGLIFSFFADSFLIVGFHSSKMGWPTNLASMPRSLYQFSSNGKMTSI